MMALEKFASPIPPHVDEESTPGYETCDFSRRAIIVFGIILLLIGSTAVLSMRSLIHWANRTHPVSRLAIPVAGERLLMGFEDHSLASYRAEQQQIAQKLDTYGWVSRERGIAHIPIERAIDLLLSKGVPVRPQPQEEVR